MRSWTNRHVRASMKKTWYKFDEPLLLSEQNCLEISRYFFFFFFFLLFDSSFSWLDTTFLEFFLASASSSGIGLPLNRVNRVQISGRFSVPSIEEEKFADARLYICNFAIYRHSVRFQGCIVQPPTLSLASPPVRHPRNVDLSFDSDRFTLFIDRQLSPWKLNRNRD